jgi:hypothetical protein
MTSLGSDGPPARSLTAVTVKVAAASESAAVRVTVSDPPVTVTLPVARPVTVVTGGPGARDLNRHCDGQ